MKWYVTKFSKVRWLVAGKASFLSLWQFVEQKKDNQMRRYRVGIIGVVCLVFSAYSQWTTDWETQYLPNVVPEELRQLTRMFVDSVYRYYSPGKFVWGITFAGRDTAFLAFSNLANFVTVLRTTDYGRRWDSVLMVERHLRDPRRFGAIDWEAQSGRLYVLIDPVLWWTEDLGQTWQNVDLSQWFQREGKVVTVASYDIEMMNAQEGIIPAVVVWKDTAQGTKEASSYLLVTKDQWASVDTVRGVGWGYSMVDIAGAGKWIVHNYDEIWWTSDYGEHWDVIDLDSLVKARYNWSPTAYVTRWMDVVDWDRWYVIANYYPNGSSETVPAALIVWEIRGQGKEIRKLLDTIPIEVPWGGMRDVRFTGPAYQIDFLDTLRGVVVGSPSQVWLTSDGGRSWERQAIDFIPDFEPLVTAFLTSVIRSCAYGGRDRIIVGGPEYAFVYRPGALLRRPFVYDQHQYRVREAPGYDTLWYWAYWGFEVEEVPFLLRWQPVEGAERYRVVVYEDDDDLANAEGLPKKVMDTVVVDTTIGIWVDPKQELVVVYLRAEGGGKVSNWVQLKGSSADVVTGMGQVRLKRIAGIVSPNPSRGWIRVRYPSEEGWAIEIRDLVGRVVHQRKQGAGEREVWMELSRSGTYYVRLWRGDRVIVVPVVVVR